MKVVRLAVLAASSLLTSGLALGQESGKGFENQILARGYALEMGQGHRQKYEQSLSSGVIYTLLESSGELKARADAAQISIPNPPQRTPASASGGCPNVFVGGRSSNTRVNQECSLRRQAEEVVAVNPLNPDNLIAGQNDSRIGFNHCGYDFSFDGGRTWSDMTPPFWQFLMADGHTADACSDPTVTFDADGNAYVGGILFQINSNASAFVVAKSNAGIDGTFFHTPTAGPFQEYSTAPLGVVASDNSSAIFHDKEFIVADASRTSPKKNNVYATWTRFAFTGIGVQVHSPIYFSQSADGGATWSSGIAISGASATLCGVFSGSSDPNACDQDQGSHPVVGTDGTIYVAFGNGNTSVPGGNQVLLVSCPGTADCTNPTNWTSPVKVGDLIGTHPIGPSSAGCPFGRGCLPPNGYRVPEFTSISAAVDGANRVYVTWSDFRNGGGSCSWLGGAIGSAQTATPPCDNDVFYAYSTDGGASFSSTVQLTPAGSAQWMPWSAATASGDKLYVAYYDRSVGSCEYDGCADITLATVRRAASSSPAISRRRITTSSMPNLTPANNPLQAGFLGDYMWVAVDSRGRANIVWGDTRGLGGTVEEDIYHVRTQ